jgi:hypothetical protein
MNMIKDRDSVEANQSNEFFVISPIAYLPGLLAEG